MGDALHISLFRSACAGGVLLTALTGCASLSERADPEHLSALRAHGLDAQVEARTDTRLARLFDGDNPTGQLDETFGELSLSSDAGLADLMEAALETNPAIGRAAQNINRAQAQRLNAIFGYLPQISASLQRDNLDQEVVESDNQVFQLGQADYPVDTDRIQVTQPIFDLSRIFGIRIANSARSLSEVEYVKAVKDVMAEVFDNYVVAVQSKRRADLLEDRLVLMDEQLAGLQDRINVGEGQLLDLTSMRSERGSLAAEVAFERTRYQDAISALSALSGHVITDGVPCDLPAIPNLTDDADVETLVASGFEENPAIMAAALQVVMSNQEKWQARFDDFAPVLNAYASLEREDRADSRFGGGSVTDDQVIGLQLTIPIFNANGRGLASLTERVDERIAALDYFAVRREVETSIRGAHERLGALRTAIDAAARATEDAEGALEREQVRVQVGQGVDYGVLSRRVRMNIAEERLAFYQAEYLRAWGELEYLTGGSLNEVIE
jgi:outer membrane protein TolC